MSENEKKIEIKEPNLPLEPIVGPEDPEYAEIKSAYDALLAEYHRACDIVASQIDGFSWSLNKDNRIYSVDEYNEVLVAYKAARKAYVKKYKEKLETIDMVREKIRKIEEELERFDRENPANEEPPNVPDFEEIPNEPWEDFCRRNEAYWEMLRASIDKTREQLAHARKRGEFMKRRFKEQGKFGELEYEMAFRFRHTYIDPKTGDQEYRPDDDVGEGLVCLGSRDYNPKREDFDD